MQQDKDQDNGINIKFKSDPDKKGAYKLIAKYPKNGQKKNFQRNQKKGIISFFFKFICRESNPGCLVYEFKF